MCVCVVGALLVFGGESVGEETQNKTRRFPSYLEVVVTGLLGGFAVV